MAAWMINCASTKHTSQGSSAPPGSGTGPGTHTIPLEIDGTRRTYVIHVPADYTSTRRWPVVVMFHGGGGDAGAAIRSTGWDRKADEERFLAVFPQGTASRQNRRRSRGEARFWNDGSNRRSIAAARDNVDDIEFVARLLADLENRYSIDSARVYATGFSNGAGMAFRVARELSTDIAAVAPVAGADWRPEVHPVKPVPLLYMTGDADPLNPIAGGAVRVGRRTMGTKPPVKEMVNNWLDIHDCERNPGTVYDRDGDRGLAYRNENGNDVVVLYTLNGHGHHWPGSSSRLPDRLVGPNTSSLDATGEIWRFFTSHTISTEWRPISALLVEIGDAVDTP